MAQQEGPLRFTGMINGLSFYFDKRTGYQVRTKGGVDRKRMKTDSRFERTRDNSNEFARAARSAKALRLALHTLILRGADGTLVNRLNARMLQVVKSDPVSARGLRTPAQGNCTLLTGFELNAHASFTDVFGVPVSTLWESMASRVTINLDHEVSQLQINAPQGATHLRISGCVVAVNFETLETHSYKSDMPVEWLALADLPALLPSQTFSVPASGSTHLVIALGVEFWREENRQRVHLLNKQGHAGMIAEVVCIN